LASQILIEVLEARDNFQGLELACASIKETFLSLLEGVLQCHIANNVTMNGVTDKLETVLGV
jgi:hypothetical protein